MAVDLAAAKAHLNILTDVDNTIIGEKLAAAKSWFERQLGYTLATEYPDGVPPAIDQGILLMTAHYYANREATVVGVSSGELPLGVCDIVNDWRNWSWGEPDDE